MVTTLILCAAGPLMAEEGEEPSLLLRVETLTLLEDHLVDALKSAKSRDAALVEYLDSVGKTQEYEECTGPDGDGPNRLTYEDLVETARDHIEKNNLEVSGPFGPIKDMSEDRLNHTLTMLEKMTNKRFAQVEKKRAIAHSIGSYLHSIGKFDAYMKWTEIEAVKADEEHSAEMARRRSKATEEQDQKKEQVRKAVMNEQLDQDYQSKRQDKQGSGSAGDNQNVTGYVGGYWDDYPDWNGYGRRWHDGRIRRPVGERGRGGAHRGVHRAGGRGRR